MVRAAVLAAFALAALACPGGMRDPGSGERSADSAGITSAEACRADADCATGFCDRDRCASPQPEQSYGRACAAGPAPADDVQAAKLHVCGAYLCRAGRCRSCTDDTECQTILGAPRCVPLPGRPGRRCGVGP